MFDARRSDEDGLKVVGRGVVARERLAVEGGVMEMDVHLKASQLSAVHVPLAMDVQPAKLGGGGREGREGREGGWESAEKRKHKHMYSCDVTSCIVSQIHAHVHAHVQSDDFTSCIITTSEELLMKFLRYMHMHMHMHSQMGCEGALGKGPVPEEVPISLNAFLAYNTGC